jgi:chlorobactene lauroyltransferase
MLKANKIKWFESLFRLYNRNLLKRRFRSLRVKNLSALKNRSEKKPLIIYANHSSWWDGLVLFEILNTGNFDSYVLMEEKQLKKYRFFQWLGAFSIDRENPRAMLESLDYAAELLGSGSGKTLVIFPQGEILPNDLRPIKFFRGLSYIIDKTAQCRIIPCSLRYEFLGDYKPDIFVRFGNPETIESGPEFERKRLTAELESKMSLNLDSLKSDIIEMNFDEFLNIL